MVARILSSHSIRGILNYNENKVQSGAAQLILANRFAVEIDKLNTRQKLVRFERLTGLNDRAKRNAMHIMLNFDKEDSLDSEKLLAIAISYMGAIGFGDQPYLVYQHFDVSNRHIHIVSTNIKPDGKRIDFHNIGRSTSETARKNIEREFNLVRAEHKKPSLTQEIKHAKIKAVQYGEKPTKQAIYNVIAPVIGSYAFSSLAELNAILAQFNVIADRGQEGTAMFEKRGLVYSVLNDDGRRIGAPIKASLFAGRPTLGYLEKKFALNKFKKQAHRQSLMEKIDEAFHKHRLKDAKSFLSAMEKVDVDTIFRRSPAGQVYGITYVDHQTKTVFNGSDLGKAYSAKSILAKLELNQNELKGGLDEPIQKHYPRAVASSIEVDRVSMEKDKNGGLLETLMQKDPVADLPSPMKRKKKKKQQRSQSI